MSAGESFIDIEVRRGPLFRKVPTTERLPLPMSWQVSQRKWQIMRLPLFIWIFAISSFGFMYNGWIVLGAACFIYFSFVAFLVSRMKLNLMRIGPARVTIHKSGFNDERLGPGLIPWQGMRILITHHGRRDGPPVGISMLSEHEPPMAGARVDYTSFRRAYFLTRGKTKRALYVDFAGVPNAVEIEKAVRALIHAANPR